MDYTAYVFLLGRVLFGGFFVLGGINHFEHLDMMSGFAASKGVPVAKLAVILSGLMIIAGGLSLVIGAAVPFGLGCIIVFLVVVTPLMHNYWAETDMMQRINQRVNFQKNVALLGSALMLLVYRTVLLAHPDGWPISLINR